MDKQVSKEEFFKFVKKYPRKLEWDVCGICDPPLGSYNDFSDGKVWPESIVSKVKMGKSMYGFYKTKEENDKYCIDEYYIVEKNENSQTI